MAELRDSSLLFSLDSLFAQERQRVDDEHAAAERRRLAALDAEVAQERARLAEAARRATEARERAMAEEQRRRDEEARLEGIKQAELERARFQARLESETELAAQRARAELELEATRAQVRARTVRGVVLGSVVLAGLATLAVVVLLARGFASGPATPPVDDAPRRASIEELRRMLSDGERQRQELKQELERQRKSPAPAPTISAPRPVPGRPARPPSHPATPHQEKPCVGDPHDPLNPCLGG